MIPLDRLVLGTVKFGLNFYGYGSTSRPTARESIAIIRAARKAGISRFDTALGYGDALALLEYVGVPRQQIVVKARLPLTRGDLVHNPTVADMAEMVFAPRGVSVYTVAEVAEAKRRGLRPIQAPACCLNPVVDVEYGRAPFLQGVLLRSPARAPESLRETVAAFQALAEQRGILPLALALASAHGERIVFGVSSLRQLHEVLEARQQNIPSDAIAEARALGQTVDATAALPSLWKGAVS